MSDFKGSDLGRNVKAKRVGDVLTITIDLSKDLGPSATGKSRIIASTGGNKPLEGGAFIGVNVYRTNS